MSWQSPKTRILAVDDNPVNLDILEEIFTDAFRVECVESGEEALDAARRILPHAILLDVMMPGMDGLQTCRQLRQIAGLSETAIIMVSAKAMPSEQAAGIAAGATDYITKPFDEVELLEMVRRYCDPLRRDADATVSNEESSGRINAGF